MLKPTGLVAIGWTGFILENLLLSHHRSQIIEEVGDKNYHLIYNSLSTLSCLTISVGLLRSRGQIRKPYGNKTIIFLCRSVGLLGLSQLLPSLQNPVIYVDVEKRKSQCPIDFSHTKSCMDRITRHPMLFSMAALGLSFGLKSGVFARVLGLGIFPGIMAVVGGAHQDWRYRRGIGGTLTPERDNSTSLIPFQALVTGKQKWSDVMAELKVTNAVVAVLLALSAFL